MSVDKFDQFGDIIGGSSGIFGDDQAGLEPGLKNHNSVRGVAIPEGACFELQCQGCGIPTQVCVSWPELVGLKYGINPERAFRGHNAILPNPTRWEYVPTESSWRADLKCSKCNFSIPLRVDLNEPERWLEQGRAKGFISQLGEQQVTQIALAAKQAAQQAQGRR